MRRVRVVLVGLAAAGPVVGLSGCSPPRSETIAVKAGGPMDQIQATLGRYAKGQPMASEASNFDIMVSNLRKTDAAKADILKAGFDDLKTTKGSLVPKAKELMKKLGLEVPADAAGKK